MIQLNPGGAPSSKSLERVSQGCLGGVRGWGFRGRGTRLVPGQFGGAHGPYVLAGLSSNNDPSKDAGRGRAGTGPTSGAM